MFYALYISISIITFVYTLLILSTPFPQNYNTTYYYKIKTKTLLSKILWKYGVIVVGVVVIIVVVIRNYSA